MYDTHGMSAFDSAHGNGNGPVVDIEEMLSQMFGMGGGMPPGFERSARPQGPRKGRDEEHPYQVTLEDLYKGKTAKFASTKKVVCNHCKGSGGKDKAKAKRCALCQGRGWFRALPTDGLHADLQHRLKAKSEIHWPRVEDSGNSHLRFVQR